MTLYLIGLGLNQQEISKEGLEISTTQGILLITKVKPEGKGEMFARDWANGGKVILGGRFE